MRCCRWIALIAVGLAAGVSACGVKKPLSPSGTAGTGAAGTGAAGVGVRDAGPPEPIPSGDVAKVVPTSGCGQDPGQAAGTFVAGTIQTMGTKPETAADSKKGDWSYQRQYFVRLPSGYDATSPHVLLFEGPRCSVAGDDLYALTNEVNAYVIRVGLTPPPNDIGHATNPDQGCFDDKEGDDSVDWVFYEKLYDRLAAQLCFDRNRVFALANSTGFSNELGCKYAGDAVRPIRGIMSFNGTFSTDPRFRPTCTTKPMAGFWVHEVLNQAFPLEGTKVAIARAMQVNGCTVGTGFDDAQFDDFPAGSLEPLTCKRILGCPPLHPLVVCPRPLNSRGSGDAVMNPGVTAFVRLFSSTLLLSP